eukprot:TRINITY_DN38487_c0_g2_i2.p1 TRINITY_DN38487_c0_g2~~TRINITY_DN38487_c0_g2_i2.p1  ORF type:complete len:208 (-),score=12.51 TRINITY_DN38487_c0_g2_i2:250-873(-)
MKWLRDMTHDVLDVGCGAGALSATAMKMGHTFTAVDIDPGSVALAKRNMALNGLNVPATAFALWDMTTAPPPELLASGPWDMAFTELTSLLISKFNEDPRAGPDVMRKIVASVIPTFFSLPVKRFLFVGNYEKSVNHASMGIHFATASIMDSLAALGREPAFREPCTGNATGERIGGCERRPTMSPKFWLQRHGMAPPTCHNAYVVW